MPDGNGTGSWNNHLENCKDGIEYMQRNIKVRVIISIFKPANDWSVLLALSDRAFDVFS